MPSPLFESLNLKFQLFNSSLRGAAATKQPIFPCVAAWIASLSLLSGAHPRHPVARNDEARAVTELQLVAAPRSAFAPPGTKLAILTPRQ
jgi:hypothetical protein